MKRTSAFISLFLAPVLAAQDNPPAAPVIVERELQAPEPRAFRQLFEPFRTERAALSPDGRHLAYTVREDGTISIIVIDLEQPETVKTCVRVVDDRAATLSLGQNQRESIPGRVLWLRWVSPDRVVVETNEQFSKGRGAVFGFDADGNNARKLADPRKLPQEPPKLEGAFVTSRRTKEATLIPTPDEGSGELDDLEDLGFEIPDDLGFEIPDDDDAIAATDATNDDLGGDRSLHIFDFDSERAGAVKILSHSDNQGNDTYWIDVLSLDSRTGKLTQVGSERASLNETTLLDRRGLPRLTVPNTMRFRFPFRYTYHGSKGHSWAKPLDEVIGKPGFTLSPENYFGERSVPLGFAEDPNVLYYASNVGRDTYGIYSFDLASKQSGALQIENPAYDLIGPPGADFPDRDLLVFDRFTHELAGVRVQTHRHTTIWLRPEWQEIQNALEKALPGRSVALLEWDESGERFLVATEGPADPGGFHVYFKSQNRLLEIARRAPWIDRNRVFPTLPFAFTLEGGTRLEGYVTVPTKPRIKPIPMIILCPDVPWAQVTSTYDREVHALAGMGFAVIQLNSRGTWGTGRQQRQKITAGYDQVQIEDLVAITNALTVQFKVNPKRVALMGRGHGGFVALRALQEYPDKFRCAIAMEPPVDPGEWLESIRWTDPDNVLPHLTQAWLGDEQRLRTSPLTSAPEKITKPIFVLSYPGPDGGERRLFYLAARRFVAGVRNHGGTAEFADLRTDYISGLPEARAAVFDSIEDFLNVHIYDFKVKVLPLEIDPE